MKSDQRLLKSKNSGKTSSKRIEENFERYLKRRKTIDYIRKWAAILAIISVVGLAAAMYADTIRHGLETLFLSDVEIALKENISLLKKEALKANPPQLFPDVQKRIPANIENPEAKYAFLIHRYNNDFYGRVFRLDSKDERYLYTYMTYSGFDLADLMHIRRPFSDDSSRTVKEWLFKKTGASPVYSAYFNPVYQKLATEIQQLERELDDKLRTPFEKEIADSVLQKIPLHKTFNSQEEANKALINILSSYSVFIDEERTLLQKLSEKKQELNIRLGLFQVFLAREYEARTSDELYGWLTADYKGKDFFSRRRPRRMNSIEEKRYANADNFAAAYKQSNILYKKLDLFDETIHLYNPLQMPLEIKTVGLFNAHRRNERGRSYKHRGVDLMADEGTPVYPVREGFVIYVGKTYNGNGNFIKIWHDNKVVSSYSHLNTDAVWQRSLERFKNEGPFWVDVLTPIASVGMTGNIPTYDAQYGYPHLHLEVTINDNLQNPLSLFNEAYRVFQE